MRFLAIIHKYPPIHNAGAEWMLHAIFKRFLERGHEATVVFPGAPNPYRLDGVLVADAQRVDLHRLALEHDAVVTHLDKTETAVRTAKNAGRPLVHLVHNDRQLQFHRVRPDDDTLIVPNSEWIARELRWPGKSVICRPPVEVARYTVDDSAPREKVTLVNLTHAKGSPIFYELAQRYPTVPFLGVAGAYGIQETRPARRLSNVELLENTSSIVADVYARTRVLLMPSSYESWGRVAIEAACSGIPTIAAPTPGLLEALGDAGIFVERDDRRGWARELTALDDAGRYAEASGRAKYRAKELEAITDQDLAHLEAAIVELLEDHRTRLGAAYHRPDAMIVSSNLAAAVGCPICGAASCSCTPDAATVGAALVVTTYDAPPRARGDRRIYRTYRGDFIYRESDAIRQGLLPDPNSDAVPQIVMLRIRVLGRELLARTATAYRDASPAARAGFLTDVGLSGPRELTQRLEEYLDDLERGPKPAKPTTSASDEDGLTAALAGRVGDVIAWVDGDPDKARRALAGERAAKNRSTLIAKLEEL